MKCGGTKAVVLALGLSGGVAGVDKATDSDMGRESNVRGV